MDEYPQFEPDGFEERKNSLPPFKEKKPKDPMRRETHRSSATGTEGFKDLLHETYGIRYKKLHKDIQRINSIMTTQLALGPEVQTTIETVKALRKLKTYSMCDSAILSRVMSKIESKIEGEPEWKRTFLLGGLKVSWIVARKLIPKFSSAEAVWNAIEERDLEKLAIGVVSVAVPKSTLQCFSWLLGAR